MTKLTVQIEGVEYLDAGYEKSTNFSMKKVISKSTKNSVLSSTVSDDKCYGIVAPSGEKGFLVKLKNKYRGLLYPDMDFTLSFDSLLSAVIELLELNYDVFEFDSPTELMLWVQNHNNKNLVKVTNRPKDEVCVDDVSTQKFYACENNDVYSIFHRSSYLTGPFILRVVSRAFTNGNQYGSSCTSFYTLNDAINYYIVNQKSGLFNVYEFDTASEMFMWIGMKLSEQKK